MDLFFVFSIRKSKLSVCVGFFPPYFNSFSYIDKHQEEMLTTCSLVLFLEF